MAVLDTSVILDKIRKKEDIRENITVVSMIEYPPILRYIGFKGKIYYPKLEDFKTAYTIQDKLYQVGKMKSFADLILAAICINKKEELVTKDIDFKDIAEASELKAK